MTKYSDVVTAASFSGPITGAVTGNVTSGSVTGQFTYPTVTRIATLAGATTGTIAAAGMLQFVTVSVETGANDIIILPPPTPGTIVILRNGATGYELRTTSPTTVAINGGVQANAESAIAANTMVIAICTTATAWQAISVAGAVAAAVQVAAT